MPLYACSDELRPGWTVTYMQRVRHGGLSTGYISSGFFGGLFASAYLLRSMSYVYSDFRPDTWPSVASMGEQDGKLSPCFSELACSESILLQVGERYVIFLYVALSIG